MYCLEDKLVDLKLDFLEIVRNNIHINIFFLIRLKYNYTLITLLNELISQLYLIN